VLRSRVTQLPLFGDDLASSGETTLPAHERAYAVAFRALYYHLYSNSNTSRAERIVADLANLLLCKIAGERDGGQANIEQFLRGEGAANDLLLPVLLRSYPHLADEGEQFRLEDETLRYSLRESISARPRVAFPNNAKERGNQLRIHPMSSLSIGLQTISSINVITRVVQQARPRVQCPP